jgi:ABC-2 type transport system permease protein
MSATMNAWPVAVVNVPERNVAHELRAVAMLWRREWIRFSSDRLRILTMLLQPLLYLFVLGTGLSALTGKHGVNLRTFMFPGTIAMAVLFTAVFSAGSIVMDREFGFLREMLVAPVSRGSIVLGKCLGSASVATCQGAIVLCLAGLVGVPYSLGLVAELLVAQALLGFSLSAFGLMAAARVSTMQGFMAVTQMFMMPLFFTAGAMFPLSGLPAWLTVITRVNPLTYAIDPIRRAVFAHLGVSPAVRQLYAPGITWGSWRLPVAFELLIVAVMGLTMLAVAVLEFRNAE